MEDEDRWIIMADMQGEWFPEQNSEDPDPQDKVNTYVSMILQLILTNPYISISTILLELVSTDWAGSREQILECFGGWNAFCLTIERMEPLRAAAVNDRLTDFPITTHPLEEHEHLEEPPAIDGHIAWWAPQIGEHAQPFLFSIHRHGGGVLCRFPNEERDTRQ